MHAATPASDAPPLPAPYVELMDRVREAALLGSTAALLGWDRETGMPPAASGHRAAQLAQLARLRHELILAPRVADLLAACETDPACRDHPDDAVAVNLRELRRELDRAARLPAAFVGEKAETTSLSQQAWVAARRDGDEAGFRPWLARILDLGRREAELLGAPAGGEPWDALLDDREPGMRAATLEALYAELVPALTAFLGEIEAAPHRPDTSFNDLVLPVAEQEAFVRDVVAELGFDFGRGRLDRSAHPFCMGVHPDDVRLTTRFQDHFVLDALGSTMHEAGHGMYEQGLPREHAGTPIAHAASYGVHESQSRLWENQVGRGRPFWEWLHPRLEGWFGGRVRGFDLDALHGAANRILAQPIRVEADEVTYDLHVFVRFELERALFRGDLDPDGLAAAWNERYRELLGVEVTDARQGYLQDVHWSAGYLGYFPTYTLGNVYASQLFVAARAAMPDLDDRIRQGDFAPLATWLREQVHRHGRRFAPAALIERVTGAPPTAAARIADLRGRIAPIFGLRA